MYDLIDWSIIKSWYVHPENLGHMQSKIKAGGIVDNFKKSIDSNSYNI